MDSQRRLIRRQFLHAPQITATYSLLICYFDSKLITSRQCLSGATFVLVACKLRFHFVKGPIVGCLRGLEQRKYLPEEPREQSGCYQSDAYHERDSTLCAEEYSFCAHRSCRRVRKAPRRGSMCTRYPIGENCICYELDRRFEPHCPFPHSQVTGKKEVPLGNHTWIRTERPRSSPTYSALLSPGSPLSHE